MIGGSNIHYDVADRTAATGVGRIGSVHLLAKQLDLVETIDSNMYLLKVRLPYHESDHVLSIAYNVMCGGDCLQDIDQLRNDEVHLIGLGAERVPDPTTAGDFRPRFESAEQVDALTEAINPVRANVWKRQDASFFQQAEIDADGTVAPTTVECKERMDMHHTGNGVNTRW